MTARIDREGPIHRSILAYLRYALPGAVIHHSPNEGTRGGRRGIMDGKKRKAMGVLAGYPDFVIHYRGKTVLLEVKAPGGSVSKAQKAVISSLRLAGAPCRVVRGVDEAKDFLALCGLI